VARAAQHLRIFSQVLSERGEDWGHLRKTRKSVSENLKTSIKDILRVFIKE